MREARKNEGDEGDWGEGTSSVRTPIASFLHSLGNENF